MNRIIFAPERPMLRKSAKIFLAGTIDMGESINWQREIYEMLDKECDHLDIYNPRRPDWNSDWEQSKYNKNFRQQVEWELDMLEQADLIIMAFLPNSKSPISLLELGAYANDYNKSILVYCPDEFYRKGNVDIFCERKNILVENDWDAFKVKAKSFAKFWLVRKVPPYLLKNKN